MRSMLTAFAALTALAVPAGLPAIALAATQSEMTANATPSSEDNSRHVIHEVVASAPSPRAEPPPVQDTQDRRGGGRGGRDGGGDRGGDRDGGGDRRGDRGGDRGGRGDGGGWNRGGPDTGNSPDRWNRPNPPVVTAPTQDRGGQDRGDGWRRDRDNDGRGRDNDGGSTRGGDRDRDGRGQDWNRGNGGRDRDNGGWNRGGQTNGGWDRDRDRDNSGRNWRNDRNGRRDYNGWSNRWNQNDWRRDWSRGRGNDWWRNDRGFRGYTGFRSGFYFAPNYGYYSVPRSYWGQRWYQGDYLPSIFWRYSLSDYRTYGLGYPPPGTQWVAVDTTIYLIDSHDGYIIEVIHDAWRW